MKVDSFPKVFTIVIVSLFLIQYSGYYFFGLNAMFALMLTSYALNYSLGLTLILLVIKILDTKSIFIGWSFIVLSSLKFLFFFLFIWPEINLDHYVSKGEALSFFVPYLACILMELGFLSKRLNRL